MQSNLSLDQIIVQQLLQSNAIDRGFNIAEI
jgi:hypothetical protein